MGSESSMRSRVYGEVIGTVAHVPYISHLSQVGLLSQVLVLMYVWDQIMLDHSEILLLFSRLPYQMVTGMCLNNEYV